jgi:STE24 endopeptidase
MNEFTVIFLAVATISLVVHWLLTRRHIQYVRKHRATVPVAFDGKIPLAAHQKAADYTEAKVRLNLYELVIATVILLIWTIGGGLQLLGDAWRSQGYSMIWTGTMLLLSFFAISTILDLPLSYYRTFKLEQRFGFNKSTPKIFFSDLFKNMVLGLLIGTPMILLVLWIMEHTGSLWWLYVWLTWLVFSLFMMWAYPAFIAPLFNKFRPLENQSLKQRIENLLSRNGFTSQGIFVMDGSTRSTHGNAYFTGLGANKRIVFFDTLIDELSPEEIEAVLAHELGHFKCNHIKKRIATLGVVFFIGLALLGWLIDMPWFYTGLGVAEPSTYMALLLFIVIAPVFTFFLQPVFSWISRQHEFEADDFAAAQAQTENLIQALVKLYKENANTLTPDPLYSAFHDSHPPAPIRIKHLSARTA